MPPRGRERPATLATLLALVLLLGLGACGDDDAGSATDEATHTPQDAGVTIDVTREGDEFVPSGVRVDRPGVVEVESHDPDVIVLQLEVR